MRKSRLFIVTLVFLLSFTLASVIAQEETEEPTMETTEEVVDEDEMEATEEVEDEEQVEGAIYVVRAGDTLFRISQRFGLTTKQLAEANNITNTAIIFVGQELIIPGVNEVDEQPESTPEPEATEEPDDSDDAEGDGATYVVRAGDNLFRIALRFGITTDQLAEANGITNPSLIFVGQELTIPGVDEIDDDPEPEVTETPTPTETEVPDDEDTDEEPTGETSTYIVQPGDTLFRIAVRNNTTVARLLALNPAIVNPNLIFVGQSITLPGGDVTEDTEDDDDEASDDMLDIAMASGVEILSGDDYASMASLATQLGVDWVKITVDWAVVEPEEGEFEFDDLDSAIDTFSDNFDIVLLLTGAPDWARPSATDLALEQPTYGPPDDLSTFGAFAAEVANRYAGQVDAYEIWFQPNNRLTWMTTEVTLRSDGFPDARLSDVRYIDLLEAAYIGINQANPDALVLTAGLAPTGNNDFYNSIDNFVFFEALLQQGASNFSDGIAVHVDGFSNAPDATCCGEAGEDPAFDESYHFFFADTLDNYREILDRNNSSDMPLWVTRFGWGTAEGASSDGSDAAFVTLNSAEEQAEYVTQAFELGAERGDVGAMILFNLNGCSVGNSIACYYSLLDSSGAARPAFNSIIALDLTSLGDE